METRHFHPNAEQFPEYPEESEAGYKSSPETVDYEPPEPPTPERVVREDEFAWHATHRPEARDPEKHIKNVIDAIEQGEAKEIVYEKRAEVRRDKDEKEAVAEPQSASPIGSVLREQARSRPDNLPQPPEVTEEDKEPAEKTEIPGIFDAKPPVPLYGKAVFAGFAIAILLMVIIILIGLLFGR